MAKYPSQRHEPLRGDFEPQALVSTPLKNITLCYGVTRQPDDPVTPPISRDLAGPCSGENCKIGRGTELPTQLVQNDLIYLIQHGLAPPYFQAAQRPIEVAAG